MLILHAHQQTYKMCFVGMQAWELNITKCPMWWCRVGGDYINQYTMWWFRVGEGVHECYGWATSTTCNYAHSVMRKQVTDRLFHAIVFTYTKSKRNFPSFDSHFKNHQGHISSINIHRQGKCKDGRVYLHVKQLPRGTNVQQTLTNRISQTWLPEYLSKCLYKPCP